MRKPISQTNCAGLRGAVSLWILLCAGLVAAEVDVSKLPTPANVAVDFDRDVRPIFENSCFRCHGPNKPKSHFRLDNREAALKGGNDNADDIVPGDSARSRLIHYVAGLDEDIEMPPPGKGKRLGEAQIRVLRAWIDQGARWSTNTPPPLSFSITPTLRWVAVSGNRAKFREVEGLHDGGVGGIERFSLREQLAPDTAFTAEGHALFGDENYQLKLALEKADLGFVRAGFESWREFYDDTGGYAPLLPTNSFALNRDLHLDVGRAWLDVGLTQPNRPRLVLGYEYQFREGDKSTLQWGPAGTLSPFDPNTDAKNVYPAFEHIDEHTHIIKLELSHELRGWRLEDNARVEFYSLSTGQHMVAQDSFGATPDSVVFVNEKYRHTSGANTLNASKPITDWLVVSGGYLYSRLEGNGTMNQGTVDGSGAPAFGEQWFSDRLLVKREAQVASLSGLFGPWSGAMLSVGVQGEWTRQESVGHEDLQIGDPNTPPLFSNASAVFGNLDSRSARENIVLRFARIPYTVVSVEARLQQESLGRFEQRPDGIDPFTRDTDADIDVQEYRAGFNTSPWSRLSFGAGFKHRDRRTDYTHVELFRPAGYLYPGFLLWRDIEDAQVDARVVWRAASWLRTSFNYRWAQSDFDSATRPVYTLSPGGELSAANYTAHICSVNAVLTPLRWLYLSSTLSFSDSRTVTAQNGADYLAPWRGNVLSVLSSATVALSTNASLRASYSFAKSDFGQGNAATGLPLGIDYERQAAQLIYSRRFEHHLVASLGYGFYQYHEPTSGGATDYRAHAVFASATVPWP